MPTFCISGSRRRPSTRTSLVVAAVALLGGGAVHAAPFTTINGLTFDLGQFVGASVTTDSDDVFSSDFDNPNGIDGFTLGELAIGPGPNQFPVDPGDRITLGLANSGQVEFLKLTYGISVPVGAGDASKYVVYEQSGRTTVDDEGKSFRISVNGGAFVDARTTAALTATGGVTGAGGTAQNQLVFDLLHPDFGLVIGSIISTVELRNIGLTVNTDDPDFLFMGRAGTVSTAPVPIPGAMPLAATGLAMIGALGWRRRKARAQESRGS